MAATFSLIIKRGEPNRFGGKSGRGDGSKVNSRGEAILKRYPRNHQLLLTLHHQYIIEDG